jgi:tRNA(fMet)-specific endonuclease VapC
VRTIHIDTNVYSAFRRGRPEIVEALAWADRLGISTVVLGELLAGFARGDREAKNRCELREFLDSPRVSVIPVTDLTADVYAQILTLLRRTGHPIPTNDVWIAACALEKGSGLLTLDAHFSHVAGLRTGCRIEDFFP